jgi:hypothetical protein
MLKERLARKGNPAPDDESRWRLKAIEARRIRELST